MTKEEALAFDLAREALEMVVVDVKTTPTAYEAHRQALAAIKQARSAPVQEPVAWTVSGKITDWSKDFSAYQTKHYTRPVYTPPAAQPAPVQEPVYHLRQFGDVTKEQLDRYMATGDINPQPAPVQPVAWYDREMDSAYTESEIGDGNTDGLEPLYTTPPEGRQSEDCLTTAQRPVLEERKWTGLTDEDMPDIRAGDHAFLSGARWAEAKLKEKNNG
jgi:hypothetical protein